MKKVIFLDRDGVVIEERGSYNYLPEHLTMLKGIEDFLKKMQEKGYEFAIVTNQGGIARGYYGHEEVWQMHKLINDHLNNYGIELLDWFYCPHHDSVSKCLCRKPNSLMLEKGIAKHNVDLKESFFIGDKDTDVEAGERVGLKTLKIASNEDLNGYIGRFI